MSTKIWGGIKFNIDSFDTPALFRVIDECRDITRQFFEDLLDGCSAKSEDYFNVYRALKEEYDASISVYWDDVTNAWYGIIHCSLNKLEESLLEKVGEIEDFHYQNSTDRPDDISEKDWDHRYQVWNRLILSKSGIPLETGLIAELMPYMIRPPAWR
jgi:hypothetical protein